MIRVVGVVGATLLALLAAMTVVDAAAHPALRRLALRNLLRRRGEALLVVVGSSLGTATIVGAFLVGATFQASARDGARTGLGPIDEQVVVSDVAKLDAAWAAVRKAPLVDTDGLLRAVTSSASLQAVPQGGGRTATSAGGGPGGTAARPDATVAEVDLAAARSFGGDVHATGLASAPTSLDPRGVVLNRSTADDLGVGVGRQVDLHAYGSTTRLTVRAVVPTVGLAGFADAFVAPGTVVGMAARSTAASAGPPTGQVLVSNRGGVFDSLGHTDVVVAELRARLAEVPGTEVRTTKRDLLRDAASQGRSIGELFTGVGTFSVLAGLLLLVNLVVMLAEERRRELGLARALGLKRWEIMRLFAMEGACYAAAAAVAGGALGVLVGWLIVAATRWVFAAKATNFHLRFVVPPASVAVGATIGFGVALVTVWVTSARIANLNIVRALRDLPAVKVRGHRAHHVGLGVAGVCGGIALLVFGLVAGDALFALVGPPLVALSLVPIVGPVLGRRTTFGVLAGCALVWCVGVFVYVPSVGDNADVPVFIVQGMLMVAAAVTLATAVDHFWVTLVERLSRAGRGLSARLGLAYPLARLGRTAMLLGTFALVVFTLTFLAVYGQIFGRQASSFTDQIRAGTDLLVDTNPANPVAVDELRAQPGVASVAPLWRSAPDFTSPATTDRQVWPLTGFDARLLASGAPKLSHRAAGYASDRAVFEAVAADPGLIVVDEQFLVTSGANQPGSDRIRLGDRVVATNPADGRVHAYRVVGLMARDAAHVGSFASAASVRSLMGPLAVPSRFYVRTTPGTAPRTVADRLDADLIDRGVDAQPFRDLVDKTIATELGFFRLMEGYLLIGLVIGTAGLGVVMVRAVRERRRQIGMLRAMGFAAQVVRRAFVVEAVFIAAQGIVMGISLGLITSYQMLSLTAALGGEPLPYSIPWAALAVLGALPLATALAAVVVPAAQAAAVNPATALYRAD